MKTKLILGLLIAPLLLIASGQRETLNQAKGIYREAVNVILNAAEITTADVGIAGKPSKNAWAYTVLWLYHPCPEREFEKILKHSNNHHALYYAILGLKTFDHRNYEAHRTYFFEKVQRIEEEHGEKLIFHFLDGDLGEGINITMLREKLKNDSISNYDTQPLPDFWNTY